MNFISVAVGREVRFKANAQDMKNGKIYPLLHLPLSGRGRVGVKLYIFCSNRIIVLQLFAQHLSPRDFHA
jgi:hypothetical protein